MPSKFFRFLIRLLPKVWQDFLKRVYDNFFLLRHAGKTIGLNNGGVSLLSNALKIAFKETINVIGNLDCSGGRIAMDVGSYRQIRNLRALKKEPETVAWIESTVKPGDVFYDIGANVGAYSFVAWAHTSAACKVYAFEPSFSTFAALCKNIFLNDASKSIVPFQVALGRITELAPLNYSDITPGGAAHKFGQEKPDVLCGPTVHGEEFSQKILCYKLDDFVKTFNLPQPNHIKLDVDGYELDVLVGGEATFSYPRLQSVLIEIDESLPQSKDVYDFFERKNFALISKDKRGGTFNCVFKHKLQSNA